MVFTSLTTRGILSIYSSHITSSLYTHPQIRILRLWVVESDPRMLSPLRLTGDIRLSLECWQGACRFYDGWPHLELRCV